MILIKQFVYMPVLTVKLCWSDLQTLRTRHGSIRLCLVSLMRNWARPTEQWSIRPIILLTSWSELPSPCGLSLDCTTEGWPHPGFLFVAFLIFFSFLHFSMHSLPGNHGVGSQNLRWKKWLHYLPPFFLL